MGIGLEVWIQTGGTLIFLLWWTETELKNHSLEVTHDDYGNDMVSNYLVSLLFMSLDSQWKLNDDVLCETYQGRIGNLDIGHTSWMNTEVS